jgi:hypothetical protein
MNCGEKLGQRERNKEEQFQITKKEKDIRKAGRRKEKAER